MEDKPLYGIWIPAQGWLKGEDRKAVAFTLYAVAKQVAWRIGSGACVCFIDNSLIDLEQTLLQAELIKRKGSLWHTFKKLLLRNKNS